MSVKYVLDTSAFINLILKRGDKAVDVLKASITADLIYYELGNFLRRVGRADLLEEFKNVLKLVGVERVGLDGEALRLALDEGLSYYDAVYLYLSRKYGAALISDDSDLIAKGALKTDSLLVGT
ncbi:MAG: type II toxin-antitoxin system VapC family toxin [Thermoproteus sp.]